MDSETSRVRITNPELATIGKLLIAARRGDVDAPVSLLRIAAEYLSSRKPMPDDLADFLAKAFRDVTSARASVAGLPIEQVRIDRLAHGLRLKRSNNRPRAIRPAFELAKLVAASGDQSETSLKMIVAKQFGVSESTALGWIKETKSKLAEAREIFGGDSVRRDTP